MIDNLQAIEPREKPTHRAFERRDRHVAFDFLQELIYFKAAERPSAARARYLDRTARPEIIFLKSGTAGERWTRRGIISARRKAVTLHGFSVRKKTTAGRREAFRYLSWIDWLRAQLWPKR